MSKSKTDSSISTSAKVIEKTKLPMCGCAQFDAANHLDGCPAQYAYTELNQRIEELEQKNSMLYHDRYDVLNDRIEELEAGIDPLNQNLSEVIVNLQEQLEKVRPLVNQWRNESAVAMENHGYGAFECVQECADDLEQALK